MALGCKLNLKDKVSEYTFQGKPIVLIKTPGRPPKGLKKKGMELGIFHPEKEIEAATIYAVTGDIKQTSELTGIQPEHLKKLIKTENFRSLLREIREENDEKFGAKFTEIVQKAQQVLLDRLENGDVKVLKDGTVLRVPVQMRDVALVTAINFDKLQLLQGKPTIRTERVNEGNKLELLAEKFAELASKGKPNKPKEIIDGEFTTDPS